MGYRPKSVKQKTYTGNRMILPANNYPLFIIPYRPGLSSRSGLQLAKSLLRLGEKPDPYDARTTGGVDHTRDFGEI